MRRTRHRLFHVIAMVTLLLGVSGVWIASPRVAHAAVIQAIDNDPNDKLWDCVSNPAHRAFFGDKNENLARCFTFHCDAPAGGISSAVMYLTIEAPTGSLQDTDSTNVAVGQPFDECSWAQGQMA